jgi:hypothetical protein
VSLPISPAFNASSAGWRLTKHGVVEIPDPRFSTDRAALQRAYPRFQIVAQLQPIGAIVLSRRGFPAPKIDPDGFAPVQKRTLPWLRSPRGAPVATCGAQGLGFYVMIEALHALGALWDAVYDYRAGRPIGTGIVRVAGGSRSASITEQKLRHRMIVWSFEILPT